VSGSRLSYLHLRGGTFGTIDKRVPEFRSRIFDCLKRDDAPVSEKEGGEWGMTPNVPLGSLEGQARPEPQGLVTGYTEPSPERKYIPTAREAEVAVQVHRCAVETGVKVRALAYQDREKTITEVGNELTELNEKVAAVAETADALRGR
jgi:hypothetical protein